MALEGRRSTNNLIPQSSYEVVVIFKCLRPMSKLPCNIPLFSSSFFVLRLKVFHQDARSRFVGAAGGAGSCAWLFVVKFWVGACAASGWGVPVVIAD